MGHNHHHHLLAAAATIVAVVALLAPGAASYPWPICSSNTSNSFAANSTYQTNLNLLAATLPGNASASASQLFATASAGAGRDQVWAAGLCRGDVNASDCPACLAQAFHDLQNDCSYIRDATIFYDACALRYSGARVLSAADTDGSTGPFIYSGTNITSDQAQFNSVVAALINATARDVSGADAGRRGTPACGRKFPSGSAAAHVREPRELAGCRKHAVTVPLRTPAVR